MTDNIYEFINRHLNSTVRVSWNWWNTGEQGSRERNFEVTATGCHRFQVLETKIRLFASDISVTRDTTSSWISDRYDPKTRKYVYTSKIDEPATPSDWVPYTGGNVIEVNFDSPLREWYQFNNGSGGVPTATVRGSEGDRLQGKLWLIDLIRPKNAQWSGGYVPLFTNGRRPW